MSKKGKKYRAAAEKIDSEKLYSPTEAIALLKETTDTNFDSTVDLHIRLGVDPRHAEQQVRDIVTMPHGLGKTITVLVFAQGDGARLAREAGADHVADDDEMIKKIQDGWTEFDVAISTPDMMSKAGRLGKVLGPRGLMPNPKTGTVVKEEHLANTIEEFKAGKVEFRLDKTANIHVPIGKASFEEKQLFENFTALVLAVNKARPPGAKGTFFRRIVLATTMGPGIKVDPAQALSLEEID